MGNDFFWSNKQVGKCKTWTLLISVRCATQSPDNTKPFSMLWHEDILSPASSLDPTLPRTPLFVSKISTGSWHVSALSDIKQSLHQELLPQKPSGTCFPLMMYSEKSIIFPRWISAPIWTIQTRSAGRYLFQVKRDHS